MFSIIIPHFNRSKDLSELIKSILYEEELVDEIIVIDDGSHEHHKKELINLQSLYGFTLLHSKNMGANYCRNQGSIHAQSEWLVFCDDDDLFINHRLKNIKSIIQKSLNTEMIINSAEISINLSNFFKYSSFPMTCDGKIAFKDFVINRFGSTSCLTIKKDSLKKINFFDENLKSLQDYELYIRCVCSGIHITTSRLLLTRYNKRIKKNISSNINNLVTSIDYIINKHSSLFKSMSDIERQEFECWKLSLLISKTIMSGKYMESFQYFSIKRVNIFIKSYALVIISRISKYI